jgi:hypothetical protein
MLWQNECEKIIKIGNQAKDIGEYDLANAAFAVLLDRYLDGFRFDSETYDGLWLEWETQDETGKYVPELYYDLLNVCCLSEDGPIGLCIPVPILDPHSAMTALKTAHICEREQHGREQREAEADEIDDLWKRLIEVGGQTDMIDAAVSAHLVNEDDLYDHPAMPIFNEAGEVVGSEYNPTPRLGRIKARLQQLIGTPVVA